VDKRSARIFWTGAVLAAVVSGAVLSATPTQSDLERVKGELERGEARAKSLETQVNADRAAVEAMQGELVRLAATAQARESDIAALGPQIQDLEDRRKTAREALALRLNTLMAGLSALERIERRPPAAMLARPGEAVDRARSAQLLAALVPRLSADAEELKSRMAEIDTYESSLIARRTTLEQARAELAASRRGIEAALVKRNAERRLLDAALGAERARLDGFAREAKDIESLLARIEAGRAAKSARIEDDEGPPPKISAQALAAVAGRLPARGRIVRAFGQADASGNHADGLTVESTEGAQVVSPVSAKVAFAGPFKGFGQLLILAAPGGYHVLLSGMTRLYVDPGQDIKGGEPVGILGEDGPPSRLYIEVRAKGKPVDPLPYLAAHDGKVSG